jgi:hypothetical protein
LKFSGSLLHHIHDGRNNLAVRHVEDQLLNSRLNATGIFDAGISQYSRASQIHCGQAIFNLLENSQKMD